MHTQLASPELEEERAKLCLGHSASPQPQEARENTQQIGQAGLSPGYMTPGVSGKIQIKGRSWALHKGLSVLQTRNWLRKLGVVGCPGMVGIPEQAA